MLVAAVWVIPAYHHLVGVENVCFVIAGIGNVSRVFGNTMVCCDLTFNVGKIQVAELTAFGYDVNLKYIAQMLHF